MAVKKGNNSEEVSQSRRVVSATLGKKKTVDG